MCVNIFHNIFDMKVDVNISVIDTFVQTTSPPLTLS